MGLLPLLARLVIPMTVSIKASNPAKIRKTQLTLLTHPMNGPQGVLALICRWASWAQNHWQPGECDFIGAWSIRPCPRDSPVHHQAASEHPPYKTMQETHLSCHKPSQHAQDILP